MDIPVVYAMPAQSTPKDPPVMLLRMKQVMAKVGISRAAIYLKMNEGTFPRNIHLGERCVAWLESDIDAWIRERILVSRCAESKR